jgi:hypothetical protein
MSSKQKILNKFREQLIIFFDELIAQFPSKGAPFVLCRFVVANKVNMEQVVYIFNDLLNRNDQEIKKMISERNDIFFINYNILEMLGNYDEEQIKMFGDYEENINLLKNLWLSGELDDDDKNVIWDWVDLFVVFSNKYYNVK